MEYAVKGQKVVPLVMVCLGVARPLAKGAPHIAL
jgi:hypothetical protein